MNNTALLFILLMWLTWLSCGNLEKEIELELPEYEARLVVECYLEPGQPFRLLLTRSQGFFEPFNLDLESAPSIFEDSATVVIRHSGITYELENALRLNPPYFNRIYNYVLDDLVPEDFDSDFELEIIDKNNETITATTRILPTIPIDSVVVEFDSQNDSLARTLTYLEDNLNEDNYFRRQIHLGALDRIPEQNFTTNDEFVDGEDGTIVFGGPFDYEIGDTLIHTIYHINKPYYDFLESIQGAVNVNGNPFGQPGAIASNLEGTANAIGIFTGISYDRVVVTVEK